MVGAALPSLAPLVGRLGWAAHRQQRGDQANHGHQGGEHPFPQCQFAARHSHDATRQVRAGTGAGHGGDPFPPHRFCAGAWRTAGQARRTSLSGGAPKGIQSPREILSRPVVSTRTPRERTPARPEGRGTPGPSPGCSRTPLCDPARRTDDARTKPRPPFGAETGPERAPLPRLPSYDEVRKQAAPLSPSPTAQREQTTTREATTVRSQTMTREQPPERREGTPAAWAVQPPVAVPPASRSPGPGTVQVPRARTDSGQPPAATTRSQTTTRDQPGRREMTPATRPVQPTVSGLPATRQSAPAAQAPARTQATPQRGDARQETRERPLPGQPASQTYRGRDRDNRDVR